MSQLSDALFTETQQRVLRLLYGELIGIVKKTLRQAGE
jgi:hypothetical protein